MSRKGNYLRYLDSGHWKNLRRKKISTQPYCYVCHIGNIQFHVHHIHYRNLLDCTLDDLLVLCQPCHELLHFALKCRGLKQSDLDKDQTKALVEEFLSMPEIKRKQEKKARSRIQRAKFRIVKQEYKAKAKFIRNILRTIKKENYCYNSIENAIEELSNLQDRIRMGHDDPFYIKANSLDSQTTML